MKSLLGTLAALGLFATTAHAYTDLTRPAGDPITEPGSITSSTVDKPEHAATYLFDDVCGSDSRWCGYFGKYTDVKETYFTYGFATPTVVNGIQLRVSGWLFNQRAPKSWLFYGSSSLGADANWTLLDSETDTAGDWVENESRTYLFTNTTAYKYYKFVVTEIRDLYNSNNFAQLSEVEFYNTNPVVVVEMSWTGAIDNDVTNPGNWSENRLPDANTIVIFSGSNVPSIPADVEFAAKSIRAQNVTLTNDCDWSAVKVSVEGKIDLQGFKFTIPQLTGECEITDSNPAGLGGELHVNVADGVVNDNTDVALTGSLKLIKDGAGTFVAHRKDQTYSGGTQVTGGQFALWNDKAGSTAWSPKTAGTIGALGTTIDVDGGARFNIVGNYDLDQFNFRLNGGRLENNSRPVQGTGLYFQHDAAGGPALGDIMLTSNSTYYVRYNMLQNRGTVDLGGHTLDILFNNNKTLWWRSGIQNGTIILRNEYDAADGGAWFDLKAPVDARTITLDMYVQFNLFNELSVSNYVSHSRNDLKTGHSGTEALNVYGTFTPVTDFFYGCTMQDGSTLDLSTRTGVWSVKSKSPVPASGRLKTTVEFAKGATIYVDLGERSDLSDKVQIVSWTKKPEGVKFELVPSQKNRGGLLASGDGIYFTRGMTILIK